MFQGPVDMRPRSGIVHQQHPGNGDAAEDVEKDETIVFIEHKSVHAQITQTRMLIRAICGRSSNGSVRASLAWFPSQTLRGSAVSRSLHTFAALHPSRDSSPTTGKWFDRSEPKHCPANTADSLSAIERDNLP